MCGGVWRAVKQEVRQWRRWQETPDPEQINRDMYRAYSELFSTPTQDEDSVAAVNRVLDDIRPTLSSAESSWLDDLPSEVDVDESLLILPSGKSLGPDGMSTGFSSCNNVMTMLELS
ncbi:hypothetical protein R1sor_021185 [Riccia sorocarpa]|uniref:Transposase n=1 Tax=Riccia sorocarpa TaxID=122646 RepID=A0ABD3GM21_9MARC